MKLGPLEVYFNPGKARVDTAALNYLRSQEVRESIARMARSEVKNYLAELAEKMEMPFSNPDEFLKLINGGKQ